MKNEPAFARPASVYGRAPSQEGMTLRDYFAAKAMAAFISIMPEDSKVLIDKVAESAYAVADAMLTARGDV